MANDTARKLALELFEEEFERRVLQAFGNTKPAPRLQKKRKLYEWEGSLSNSLASSMFLGGDNGR